MNKETIIKYVKIGLFIGGSILAFKFIRKQIKLRKLKGKFGDYSVLTDNNKGNKGGVSLPKDKEGLIWSPRSSAEAIRDAMKGWGTNTSPIWSTLDGLDKDKRSKVRIYFNTYFGDGQTLFEWFDGDLSGSDLHKAKAYFN
jgi:hypothetical protein